MKRVLTALVGALILIPICIFSNTLVWPLALTILSLLATYELLRCVGIHDKMVFAIPCYGFSLLPIATWLLALYRNIAMNRVIVAAVVLLFLCEFFAVILTKNSVPGEKVYSTIALVAYVVLAFTLFAMSRRFINGAYMIWMILFGAWISDICAFCAGKLFGKHKLSPEISPHKTVEGAIGGVVGNAVFFALFALVLQIGFQAPAHIWQFSLLGAVLSVMGQLGDMFLSSVKRFYGIKDFGKILPGHGGVLDRFDSILGISCAMYLVYTVFGSAFLIQ